MTSAIDPAPASPANRFSTWFLLAVTAVFYLAAPNIMKADLLVASVSGHNILRFDSTGKLLGAFVAAGSGGLITPQNPVFGPDGNLYVPDATVDAVFRYKGSTGAFMDAFVPPGAGGLIRPTAALFGPDGNLYVADYFGTDSGVVRRYSGTTGAYMGVFASGHLVVPTALIFGPDGNLYVGDEVNVVKFNGTTGAFMSIFIPTGSGGLLGPDQFAYGSDGNLYIGSAHSGVLVYNSSTGAFIKQLVPDIGSRADGGLAFGPDGNLYVGYFDNGETTDFVVRYNPQTGALIDDFIPVGTIGIIGGLVFTPGSSVPLAIQPTHGGNAGTVTAQITGPGVFKSGAEVKLTGIGPDIVGTNTTVPNASILTTTLDLSGAEPGIRTVVVTNPDRTSVTISDGFTIEQGGSPDISVEIIGFDKIRIGSQQTYYLAITNTGTVDSSAGILSLSIPSTLEYTQLNGNNLFVAGSISGTLFGTSTTSSKTDAMAAVPGGSTRSLLFATPGLPTGQAQYAPVQLFDVATSDFTVTSQWQQDQYPPNFDDYLAEHSIGYYPLLIAGTFCTQCPNTLGAAYDPAKAAYATFQIAWTNALQALVGIPFEVGKSVVEAEFVEGLGVGFLGKIAVNLLIKQSEECMSGDLTDTSGQSCLLSLKDTLTEAAKGVKDLLAGKLSKATRDALELELKYLDASIDAIGSVGDLNDAIGVERLALGNFQKLLGEYKVAYNRYAACLQNQCGIGPPQQPPPNPPGTSSLTITPVSSIDPNDIIGPLGYGASGWITGQRPFQYAVFFGNADTATAPAQYALITDQFDPTKLNLNTLVLQFISFGNNQVTAPNVPLVTLGTFSTSVDLRPTTDLIVNIAATLNSSTGVLTTTFDSIDPATGKRTTNPLLGFLSPGVGGSVLFTGMTTGGISTGTVVTNSASIVFDTNAAIDTPTWSNTIDKTSPTSQVSALTPVQSTSCFRPQWSGSDVGSGLASFDVLVSDNGGSHTPWLNGTTATISTFRGQAGHSYAFYSQATDLVGNIEAVKTSADAFTTVAANASCNGRPTLAGIISSKSLMGTAETLTLQLTNNGVGDAPSATINQISFRTLAGSGTVTLSSPTLPIPLGKLAAGASTNATLTVNLPATVTKFSMTEGGTLQDVLGNTYSFSIGQVVFP
ncbi:MAG: NHL repeat-containing protein [Bryobacteraceae bacterium]